MDTDTWRRLKELEARVAALEKPKSFGGFAPTCSKCGAGEGIPHKPGCTERDGLWHGELINPWPEPDAPNP